MRARKAPAMDLRIEIEGERVTCKQDGKGALSMLLRDLLMNLLDHADFRPPGEPIPETVRFAWRRGDAVVLVLEQKPAMHTVRWLTDDSPAPFGKGATYREVRLAFPFVLVIVAFRGGNFTGQQQCFYRRAPLASLEDELLLPNLLNVARAYGQTCWLCLANLRKNFAAISWNERVRAIWSHLFDAGFNASSEFHEGMSYWQAMRSVDRRVGSLSAWEAETRKDPFFPLKVEWRTAGKTVGEVMEEMMDRISPLKLPSSAFELLPLMNPPVRRNAAPFSSWLIR